MMGGGHSRRQYSRSGPAYLLMLFALPMSIWPLAGTFIENKEKTNVDNRNSYVHSEGA